MLGTVEYIKRPVNVSMVQDVDVNLMATDANKS